MSYALLKQLHVGAAAVSLALFALRGIGMMARAAWLDRRPVRIVPHVVDTLLLASAVGLAWRISQYPFVHDWLTAKILALPVYIALGSIALKHGRTLRVRVLAWLAALATFGYIVAVAVTRQPLPF